MAYQIVAAIGHRLKENGINSDWSNIIRIMNSHKMNTIKMKMRRKEIRIRKMSIPEKPVKEIYDKLNITDFPKSNNKYVVCH